MKKNFRKSKFDATKRPLKIRLYYGGRVFSDPRIDMLVERTDFDARLLNRLPYRYRDDAIQEACLAALGGRNPVTAVLNYYKGQRQYESRHAAQEDNEPVDW